MLNGIALVITDDMTIDSQGNSRVAVSQLPLHDGWSCAVCEQSTRCTMPQRMESAALDS